MHSIGQTKSSVYASLKLHLHIWRNDY